MSQRPEGVEKRKEVHWEMVLLAIRANVQLKSSSNRVQKLEDQVKPSSHFSVCQVSTVLPNAFQCSKSLSLKGTFVIFFFIVALSIIQM